MINEDNIKLLRIYKESINQTDKINARNSIITGNLGLLQKILDLMGMQRYLNEITSYAVIDIIRAVDDFDESRGVKLSTFLYRYLVTSVHSFLRDNKQIKIDDISLFEDERDPSIEDPLESLITQEDSEYLLSCLSRLRPIERETLKSFFGLGQEKETLGRIATRLGVKVNTVHQAKKEGLTRLREIF